eukprot:gnl/MRDRNA2_/MRDRNA2_109588_c0_seq1.p1 gnl/MRDRNA2_/MRDRNA2_109588_c0~~gnl/MRDRNA2_/MRDRNA2_109588_c0_seq1.p1  ORF type:complete len:316 (+),score=20.08 gnl/MRDRNA2_/MRDRNA2_109588_c0_seq1:85-1032(+)
MLSLLLVCISFNGIYGIRRIRWSSTQDDYAVRHTEPLMDEFGVEQLDTEDISFHLDPKQMPMGYVVEYNPNPNFQFNKFFQKIPEVIVQYGTPRTATTLQFHSLCALMVLLHPGQVDCQFAVKPKQWFTHAPGKKYKVIKTHTRPDLGFQPKKRFWLFITSGEAPNAAEIAQSMKVEPQYIQSFPLVKSQGWEIVADYAKIFHSSKKHTEEFLNYMKSWSLLRQCCGAQQSRFHRSVLWGDIPSSQCPACDGQNLDAVESELVGTGIFQQMRKDHIVQDAIQPDQYLNGTYCTWFNQQVACQHLGFNKLPRKPFC